MSETTADWHGFKPILHSMAGHRGYSGYWACRKVRKNGTVQIGQTYRPHEDVITKPIPGEWLLFFKYPYDGIISEWTSPADPDGFIRRIFWELAP